MAIDDDECTALVKNVFHPLLWGEIVYISGHQGKDHWAGG
jgi:hypothetical protein